MSGHQFAFPPPPPAPSKASQNYPGVSQPSTGLVGYPGSRARGSTGNRGYGLSHGRNGRRSGQLGSSQSTPSYGSSNWGLKNRLSSPPAIGCNVQANDVTKSGHPLPSYPSVQLSQYHPNFTQSYGQQIPAFPAPTRSSQAAYPTNEHGSPHSPFTQQEYPSLGYDSSHHAIQAPFPASQNDNSIQTNVVQPLLMGPPIRMGFDGQRNGHQTRQFSQQTANATNAYHRLLNGNGSQYSRGSSVGFPSGLHESLNSFSGHHGRDRKRGHGEAFNRPRNQNRHTPVAPAVPSFGGPVPLPAKPPAPNEITRKIRRKKLKHNQLGLTPKAEGHESSEEDDVDEEARLASVAASASQGPQFLQFDYKGHTSTLQSASDIAAWIKQRKRRFPTKARAAEMVASKLHSEEQRRATNLNCGEFQVNQRSEGRTRQNLKKEGEKQRKKHGGNMSEDVAARSKRKVEKLRRQLEREEKRIARAEGKACEERVELYTKAGRRDFSNLGKGNEKRKRSNSGGSGDAKIEDIDAVKPELQDAVRIVPDPLTPTSQPALADEEGDPQKKALNADIAPVQVNDSSGLKGNSIFIPDMGRSIQASIASPSDLSSISFSTNFDDSTSSSGSPSEDDVDDQAPEETSAKCNGPKRTAAPKRAKRRQICRTFLHKDFCKRGSRCKYLHKKPEGSRGAGSQDAKSAQDRKGRVGLYQRLVKQEIEREEMEAQGAILRFGEDVLSYKDRVSGEGKDKKKAAG